MMGKRVLTLLSRPLLLRAISIIHGGHHITS